MAKFLSGEHLEQVHQRFALKPRKPRRALALGGGGPAVGISLGFLLALQEWNDRMAAEDRPDPGVLSPRYDAARATAQSPTQGTKCPLHPVI